MSKFNPSAVQGIDQDTIEQDGSQYPIISFHSGDAALKRAGGVSYEGGFFIGQEGEPANMTVYGWTDDSFVTSKGVEVKGYWSPNIEVSVICQRRRWVVDGQPFAWNDYEKAKKFGVPRGHQQYLVLLKGAEDLGPLMLGLKGHAGMSFSGSKQYSSTGVLSCFNRTVIAAANAQTKPKKWPFRAFWLPVGAAKDSKGAPLFTEVGSTSTSRVVLPVPINLPGKANEVDLDLFYVGDATLLQVNQILSDAQPWATAWDTFAPNGNGKNGYTATPVAGEVDTDTNDDDLADAGL